MGITYEDIKRVNDEMKFTDIGRGKQYAEVPARVTAFRKLFPNGTITTDILSLENGVVVMKATASVDGVILGEGLAYEREGNGFINKDSYIENCQTSAVGRALGFVGIGSETSIASAEEVMNAQKQQMKRAEEEKKKEVKELLEETHSDVKAFLEGCTKKFEREIKSVDEMFELELDTAITTLKKRKKENK